MDDGIISLFVLYKLFPIPMILLTLLFLAAYFVPAFIAFGRVHPYRWPIFLINLLAGLTTIGWVAALIWAVLPIQVQPPPLPLERYEPNFNEPITINRKI